MKKLVTLLLAAGMVCSFSSPASAVELKASGEFDFTFERTSLNFVKGANNEGTNQFNALQRVRVAFDFIASEQLSARYMFQVGTGHWGDTSDSDFSQGQRSGSNAKINTRMAYIDWLVPNTSVKVSIGKKPLVLPSFAAPSFVQGGITNSIQVAAPINDNFAVTAFWMRPMADGIDDITNVNAKEPKYANRFGDVDVFGITIPMKFSGFDFIPWAAYGSVGNRAGSPTAPSTIDIATGEYSAWVNLAGRDGVASGTSNLWYVGFASRLTMFDPFTFALDAAYGSKTTSNSDGVLLDNPYNPGTTYNSAKASERAGWYVAAKASYKTPYGVPTLQAWYASGDSSNQTKKSGLMPALGSDMSGFSGGSTYFGGTWGLGESAGRILGMGSMAISAQWNQASFVQDLFHDLTVTYIQGTNHADNVHTAAYAGVHGGVVGYKAGNTFSGPAGYLTTKDSLVDVNLTSTYSIYKNLATSLELGYVFQNLDEDIRATGVDTDGNLIKPDFKNIWRVGVNFRYTF